MTFGQLSFSSAGRRSGVAEWRQIADTLSTEIRDRAYAATGRLPVRWSCQPALPLKRLVGPARQLTYHARHAGPD